MKVLLCLATAFAVAVSGVEPAAGTLVSGDVWGTWSPDENPFQVSDTLHVPPDSTLRIEAGVDVEFLGPYPFRVEENAVLSALGTEDQPISFRGPAGRSRVWGGIRLHGANDQTVISHCEIRDVYGRGLWPDNCGAIYTFECAPRITHNHFHHNDTFAGSGVYSHKSTGQISFNRIEDNAARWGGGGGLRLFHASPLVQGNVIVRNTSTSNGGGISSRHSESTIEGNIIADNYAVLIGGGIYCRAGYTNMVNNTIHSNLADSLGGGYGARWGGISVLDSNIIWGNQAGKGREIGLYNWEGVHPCSLSVDYSDIQGGLGGTFVDLDCQMVWGENNIQDDPRFVDVVNGDLSLRWKSPCIDSGNISRLDPDSTQADMGALAFDQAVSVVLEFLPMLEAPIVIPAEGGLISHEAVAANLTQSAMTFDAWTMVWLPGLTKKGPLVMMRDLLLPAEVELWKTPPFVRFVGSDAPAGQYKYVGYVGDYNAGVVIDSTYFSFVKAASP